MKVWVGDRFTVEPKEDEVIVIKKGLNGRLMIEAVIYREYQSRKFDCIVEKGVRAKIWEESE